MSNQPKKTPKDDLLRRLGQSPRSMPFLRELAKRIDAKRAKKKLH